MKLLPATFLFGLLTLVKSVPIDYSSAQLDGEADEDQQPLDPDVTVPSNYEGTYEEETVTLDTSAIETILSETLPPMVIGDKLRVKSDDINQAVSEMQKMLATLLSAVRLEFSGLKDRMDVRFRGFMHRSNEIFYDLRTSMSHMFEGLRATHSAKQ